MNILECQKLNNMVIILHWSLPTLISDSFSVAVASHLDSSSPHHEVVAKELELGTVDMGVSIAMGVPR